MLHFPADKAYAPVVAVLHATCFERPWHERDFEALLSLPSSLLIVKETGFLLASFVAGEMEILTFCIVPSARRQGQGRALLQTAIDFVKTYGGERVFLEVRADNEPALGLYHQMGFVRNGCRKGYYQTLNGNVDALCMVKTV